MERLTDCAQGYCEMYCKKYGHCFGDPGDCILQDEVKMYESLKDYECTGMSPGDIKTMAISALREQEERRWIPVTERLPELGERVLCTDGVAVFEQYRVELSCVYGIWDRFGMRSPMQEVTHWMPLPEPPKEDA